MLNKELLKQMVDEKLVSVQKHPEADLFIYNYSPRVQYEKLWNEVTLKTRGLILDSEMNIIAAPFGKFFNLEEHAPEEIPSLPFNVFDKLDGSLGILYWLNNKPYIATRGSFTSEQAIHATEVLNTKYSHLFDKLNRNKTYLFEIIYPQNRIVVDYNGLDDLILLSIKCNQTGKETIEDVGFPVVKRFDGINEIEKLRELEENNKEGFVIHFSNGFRVKMKFAEYVRLHRIITQVSNVVVWEYMSEGRSFEELLEKVPDEFYDWVKKTQKELYDKFNVILNDSLDVYKELYSDDRKTFALRVIDKAKQYSSVLFNLYDNKKIDLVIWKMIRPKYSKPFKQEV